MEKQVYNFSIQKDTKPLDRLVEFIKSQPELSHINDGGKVQKIKIEMHVYKFEEPTPEIWESCHVNNLPKYGEKVFFGKGLVQRCVAFCGIRPDGNGKTLFIGENSRGELTESYFCKKKKK